MITIQRLPNIFEGLLEGKLALKLYWDGPLGRVWKYVRPNKRCPADEFLCECTVAMKSRFEGSFGALTKMGSDYQIRERFTPLHGPGKPLWEFKEHDHRLYCARTVAGKFVNVVLLNGWSKDKKGKSKEEPRHIQTAQNLFGEHVEGTKAEETDRSKKKGGKP